MHSVRWVILANVLLKFIFLKFMRVQQCHTCECEEYVFEMALWQFLFFVSIYATSLYFSCILYMQTADDGMVFPVIFYSLSVYDEIYILLMRGDPTDTNHEFFSVLALSCSMPFLWDVLRLERIKPKLKTWVSQKYWRSRSNSSKNTGRTS